MVLRSFGFNIGINLIIGILLFTGLKSCIVSGVSIDNYILLDGIDKHEKIIITPYKKVIFAKEFHDTDNVAIYELRGREATPYFSGIYCVGTFPFGLKHYHGVEKVIDSELVLLKKHGNGQTVFNDSLRAKIIIYQDKVKIGDMSYNRLNVNGLGRDECEFSFAQVEQSQN